MQAVFLEVSCGYIPNILVLISYDFLKRSLSSYWIYLWCQDRGVHIHEPMWHEVHEFSITERTPVLAILVG